jgi:excinuclease ABC subunit C
VRTRKRRNDGALYFGPYTSGTDLAHLTRLIDRFFLLIKCPSTVFRAAKRPCNYYHIKQCLAPCALDVSKEQYAANVKAVVAVLNGKTSELKADLTARMQRAAEELRFELAGQLRDQIRALESLGQQKQSVHLDADLNADFVGVHWQQNAACFYVSHMRDGKLLSGEHFFVERMTDIPPEANDTADFAENITTSWQADSLESFLCQYYMRNEKPALVVAPGVSEFLSSHRAELLEQFLINLSAREAHATFSLVRNLTTKSTDNNILNKRKGLAKNFRTLVDSANETAKERFKDWVRTSESAREEMERLAAFLQMQTLPTWIECFDISTFQGSETVASQIVFRDGKSARGDYRRYIIRGVEGQDDFGSLREVMRRRFKEERRHDIPDLILVDGGEPQVREVSYVLRALGLGRVGIVGIAKSRTESAFAETQVSASSERIVIPARENGELAPEHPPLTKILRPGSPEFKLVTRMRDEAHRFAITLHRNRRDKVSRMSALHRIDGLGPKRRKALLTAFSGIDDIVAASAEEVSTKANIPLAVAEKVKAALTKMEKD